MHSLLFVNVFQLSAKITLFPLKVFKMFVLEEMHRRRRQTIASGRLLLRATRDLAVVVCIAPPLLVFPFLVVDQIGEMPSVLRFIGLL
jgi:hypothetical protein